MKHITYANDATKAERTSAEWLKVGANIGDYANKQALRNDLVVFVGENATEGIAPALFKPSIAEIEINTELAFGFGVTPDKIGDFNSRPTRYDFPRATGAILHEAFHARFSLWNIAKAHEDLQQDEAEVLMLLEETRIEKQGLDADIKNRVFLRTCAMELVLEDLDVDKMTELNIAGASRLMALLQGRVIAGVLDADEVVGITAIIKTRLGEDVFNRLSEILVEYQAYTNHYVIDKMYPLAIEWAKLIKDLQEEAGETQGVPSPIGKELLEQLIDEMTEAGSSIGIKVDVELYDQEEAEDWQEEVENRKSQADQRKENKEVADKVFEKSTGPGEAKTSSQLQETRKPTSGERSSAVIISKMLEKAKYRDRDLTVVSSNLPQGRLNVRAVIQNRAYKAQGMLPVANEWERKVRKQTDEPTLTVGVMVDISGSMSSAMQPMATTAWVMSEAVRRVQGRVAMVYYGQDVFPTLKAGQHLNEVQVYSAPDSTEQFDKAFKALDGSLNLLNGRGARLLVVVSDGIYTHEETKRATEWVRQCEAQGVGILWLTFTNRDNHYSKEICKGTNAVVVGGMLDPVKASQVIGQACATALEMRKV